MLLPRQPLEEEALLYAILINRQSRKYESCYEEIDRDSVVELFTPILAQQSHFAFFTQPARQSCSHKNPPRRQGRNIHILQDTLKKKNTIIVTLVQRRNILCNLWAKCT